MEQNQAGNNCYITHMYLNGLTGEGVVFIFQNFTVTVTHEIKVVIF